MLVLNRRIGERILVPHRELAVTVLAVEGIDEGIGHQVAHGGFAVARIRKPRELALGRRRIEPREAFDGGPYGIAIHQRVVRDALEFLKPGGVLLFEIGLGQAKQVTILFNRARSYDEVKVVNDSGGEPRVVYSTRKP